MNTGLERVVLSLVVFQMRRAWKLDMNCSLVCRGCELWTTDFFLNESCFPIGEGGRVEEAEAATFD